MIVKVIVCGVLFIAICGKIFAGNSINENDTSTVSLPNSASSEKSWVISKKTNPVFPAILAGNEEESISYIEKFSVSRREYLIRTFNRGKKLFPKAADILKKYKVPQEFTVLLALESGFNGDAISSAGAVGYWQIMDEVAKEYRMKIAIRTEVKAKKIRGSKKSRSIIKMIGVDDRKNFNKSTHAAARYLKDRSRNLNNDWLLIAASYNCGVGNVWNAMERSRKKDPTFWDIKEYLPAETRSYVMNFITLNVIFNNYEAFVNKQLCFKDINNEQPVPQEQECKEDSSCAGSNDY